MTIATIATNITLLTYNKLHCGEDIFPWEPPHENPHAYVVLDAPYRNHDLPLAVLCIVHPSHDSIYVPNIALLPVQGAVGSSFSSRLSSRLLWE